MQGGQPKNSSNSPQGKVKYATLIPTLCAKLGFAPPQYDLQKVNNTAFWTGYAFFPGNPFIDGKVGKILDVYGKENAKEEIAEEVYRFLKDIQRQREEQFDVQDGKRQGTSESDVRISGSE